MKKLLYYAIFLSFLGTMWQSPAQAAKCDEPYYTDSPRFFDGAFTATREVVCHTYHTNMSYTLKSPDGNLVRVLDTDVTVVDEKAIISIKIEIHRPWYAPAPAFSAMAAGKFESKFEEARKSIVKQLGL